MNEQRVTTLPVNSYFVLELDPGPYQLEAKWDAQWRRASNAIEIEVEENDTHFVRDKLGWDKEKQDYYEPLLHSAMIMYSIQKASREDALKEMRKCRLLPGTIPLATRQTEKWDQRKNYLPLKT